MTIPSARREGRRPRCWSASGRRRCASAPTDAAAARAQRLPGGVVTDASFTGVSTQYLVRLPWGQELTAFVQNPGGGGVLPVGSTVTVAWDPAHTFGLDGDRTRRPGSTTARA